MSSAEEQFVLQELPDRNISFLRVSGDLSFEARKDFVEKTRQLLASDQEKLVVDLTRVGHVFSVYFGTIADVSQQANAANKHFSVLVSERLAKLFTQTNLDRLINVVVVDGK